MSNMPVGSMVTGNQATGVAGPGFTTGSFRVGTNYAAIPAASSKAKVTYPKYPPRMTPSGPGVAKLALGKLPSIYSLYSSNKG